MKTLLEGESGKGDALASGRVKSVTYTSSHASKGVSLSDPQVREDLQNLRQDEFIEKYFDSGMSEVEYKFLIRSLSEENIPEEIEEDETPQIVQELAAKARKGILTFTPYGDNVLILPDEAAVATKGGIVIPGHAQQKCDQGLVVATGPGWLDKSTGILYPCSAKIGEKVLINKFAAEGKQIEIGGKTFLLITDLDVFGRIEMEE